MAFVDDLCPALSFCEVLSVRQPQASPCAQSPGCPAGKPIFTAHGKEDELAGFMALIQALVSVVRDTGDSLQTVR